METITMETCLLLDLLLLLYYSPPVTTFDSLAICPRINTIFLTNAGFALLKQFQTLSTIFSHHGRREFNAVVLTPSGPQYVPLPDTPTPALL